MPTELSTTNNTPQTNENLQGNLLQNYEQKFANLPYHLQPTKICSNVGITKTVPIGHNFTTLDGAELENWDAHVESFLFLKPIHHPK